MNISGINKRFDEVVEIYYPLVYRFVYVKLDSSSYVEDICQEVFCSLYTTKVHFETELHLKRWLFKVALFRCRGVWRTKWYNHVICIENIDIYEANDHKKSELEYAVSELPSKYRTLIHLYYFEDLSVKEISAIVDQKESTITSALHRARAMLKKKMKEDYDFE